MSDHGKVAVIAIGGNSLIKDKDHQTLEDQYQAAHETCIHIVDLIAQGWTVAIGHGNGPQVGFVLRRSELAAHELHEVPLDVCGADTQGAIGYLLQQNIYNEFLRRGINKPVATIVTIRPSGIQLNRSAPSWTRPRRCVAARRTAGTWLRMQAAVGGGLCLHPSPNASSNWT
jgi:carbamate kinase